MATMIDAWTALKAIVGVASAFTVLTSIYRVYFHPLSKIPGPKHLALTDLFYVYHILRGDWPQTMKQYHDKYGSAVRFAPNEVSFIDPEAWKTIYGHNKQASQLYEKDVRTYPRSASGSHTMFTADNGNHRRLRRVVAYAFSEKALQGQSQAIQSYLDLFYKQMSSRADSREVIDIESWYNFATFDLIGDLAYGKPFGCLEKGVYSSWVAAMFETAHTAVFHQVARRHPIMEYAVPLLADSKARQGFALTVKLALQTTLERMESGNTKREDFMSYILRHNNEELGPNGERTGITKTEILDNSISLLVAGSETTATVLSGLTYHLLRNRDKYDKLVAEIRSAFNSDDEINMSTVNNLPYLNAAITEASRIYPAAPSVMPRITPPGGDVISGYYIPEKTVVGVTQLAANHSEQNWVSPESFVPERWLGDPRFDSDKKEALQPFSYGPRNCIGKNLAWAEMRGITCRLLFSFDLELMPESRDWTSNQRVFIVWEKPPLYVRISRRADEKR